jgi:hypothetical protein
MTLSLLWVEQFHRMKKHALDYGSNSSAEYNVPFYHSFSVVSQYTAVV